MRRYRRAPVRRTSTFGNDVNLPNNIEAFSISAAAGSFLIEAVYGVLALAAIRLVWKMGGSHVWWRLIVVLVGLATPVLAYYGSLSPFPAYPNDLGLIFAGVSLVIVAIWFAYLRAQHPQRVASAAAHAEEHHGVPPLDEDLEFHSAGA